MPSLLIGLPVFNGETTLAGAITALLDQTHSPFQLVIADNGSTDSTPQICASAAARDGRVRLMREETNRGPTWNFNRVLGLAGDADYFMWAAADDFWTPDYAASCIAYLEAHPDAALCGTAAAFPEEAGETDPGISTMGMSPVQRVLAYARTVDRNSLFYGIYRSSFLACRTLGRKMGNDHLFLMNLALDHPFHTLPDIRLRRASGGMSRSARSIHRNLQADNTLPWPLFRVEMHIDSMEAIRRSQSFNAADRRRVRRELPRILWQRRLLPHLCRPGALLRRLRGLPVPRS